MGMNLELVKFVNSDLTWTAPVKKGRRSVLKRSRKTEANSSELGSESGNKSNDSVVYDYEQSGVAILGQHFAEEILDVPIKKRILLLQSPGQVARPPQPQTPSPDHEPPKGSAQDLNDFSGIELLAAAACHSSGHADSLAVEEHSTPRVESYPDGLKQDISPIDSNDSSVQDNAPPVTQNVCDDGNDESEKVSVPSKVRFHWDLNTVMDDWEEPCDIHVDDCLQHETSKSQVTESGKPEIVGIQVNIDADQFERKNDAESCLSKSDVVDSFVNPATCGKVSTSTASVSQEETARKVESGDKQAVSLKCDTVDKLASEDRLSDCCGSNVSQDKVKSGYDSPVEDGELREPAAHTWEKEELEEMECVDYESDNMYDDNSDAIESVKTETVYEQLKTTKASVSLQNNDVEQGCKADVSKRLVEKDSLTKRFLHERKNMCVDRPTSTSYISRNRSERDFDQEKFTAREGPSHHRGQWVDSFLRNKHGSSGYSRPNNVKYGGSSSIDNNEAINYNPRGIYRNESYGIPPSRDISRDRSRVGLRTVQEESYYTERKAPFSANYSRGANLSKKQSRSRSRSGSPIAWHFQKKRNVDTKRQSPDYKPDTRFPFRKPSETESGHLCQTTDRVIRRFDDRNVVSGQQYRARRSSPVATFHRTHQRHDHVGPRFQPNSGYSSMRDDKYGMVNERRRFRYDDDEESCKGYSRNDDNGFRYPRTENKCFRDPKYTSEERGCRYTTNKILNTGEGHFRKDN